jgi:hypothetical protein
MFAFLCSVFSFALCVLICLRNSVPPPLLPVFLCAPLLHSYYFPCHFSFLCLALRLQIVPVLLLNAAFRALQRLFFNCGARITAHVNFLVNRRSRPAHP